MKKLLLFVLPMFLFLNSGAQTTSDDYYKKGLLNDSLEAYSEAVSNYTKAIELNPSDVKLYLKRANSKNKMEDLQGAIDDYSKTIELDPKNAEYYYKRAGCKAAMMDGNNAIDDYSKAIDLSPENARMYYDRGMAKKFLLEDTKNACLDLAIAAKLGSIEAGNVMKDLCK